MKLSRSIAMRLYQSRPETEKTLIPGSLFCISLLVARMIYTGDRMFVFLVWNLFLAWIPYWLSCAVMRQNSNGKLSFVALALGWLVFVPNAFYIITDLFHLDMNYGVPLWFDLALLVSFAWSGLLLGIVSVKHMEEAVERFTGRKPGLLFIIPVMMLNGLGVYLGRYLRFNSWDIITNPLSLASEMFSLCIHPVQNRLDWSMIICYGLLLTVIYVTAKQLGRSWK